MMLRRSPGLPGGKGMKHGKGMTERYRGIKGNWKKAKSVISRIRKDA